MLNRLRKTRQQRLAQIPLFARATFAAQTA